MTKQIEDSHGESNKEELMKRLEKEGLLKHLDKEELMKWIDKEYEEFVRLSEPRFDWAEALVTVLITLLAVGGFTFNIVNVIRMLAEHKFAYWTAATNIFWATVLLGQWVYHLANVIKWKFK